MKHGHKHININNNLKNDIIRCNHECWYRIRNLYEYVSDTDICPTRTHQIREVSVLHRIKVCNLGLANTARDV
jgi:hypothetical protein